MNRYTMFNVCICLCFIQLQVVLFLTLPNEKFQIPTNCMKLLVFATCMLICVNYFCQNFIKCQHNMQHVFHICERVSASHYCNDKLIISSYYLKNMLTHITEICLHMYNLYMHNKFSLWTTTNITRKHRHSPNINIDKPIT